jgi:hypothetical protein
MRYCIYQTDARYQGYAWERVSTIQQKRRRVVDDATTFLDYLLFVPFESGPPKITSLTSLGSSRHFRPHAALPCVPLPRL